jgi:cellulose synthase/poly-beta-1,6-N-acetylglucosamine synthase-like glycosyltransferase
VGKKETILPHLTEEMMLEVTENITPKFSKIRFASLRNGHSDEQIDLEELAITEDGGKDVPFPQEHLEHGRQNGNGHHAIGSEREEWEVLETQRPVRNMERNRNGIDITDELLESTGPSLPKVRVSPLASTGPRLPKVHVSALASIQSAKCIKSQELQASVESEERTVVDSQQPGKRGKKIEQQASKQPLRGFLDSREAGEQGKQNGSSATVEREEMAVLDPQEPAKQNGHYKHHIASELQKTGLLHPERPNKRSQQNGHHSDTLNGTHPVSASPRSFNQVRLSSLHTTTEKLTAIITAPLRKDVRSTPALPGVQDQERVKFYAAWLDKQAEHNRRHDNAKEIDDYIQEAAKIVKVGQHEVAIFAPFRPRLSALQTFTTRQVIAFALIGLLWIAGMLVFRIEFLAAVVAAITIVYFLNLLINFSLATRAFRDPPEEHISDNIVNALKDAEWPEYTILCPLYKEAQVVPQFVKAMTALDYPAEKLQIVFLTEEDDAATRNAIRALSPPSHFKVVVVPDGKPRTKPRACNYGLMLAKGQFVVIYDAEDIPDPLQLKKAVLAFANHGTDVVCVQAKLNFYNIRQNLLTRWFTAEYSTWFDLILPGLQLANFSLPLGGTSNHFRTGSLRALGGWDAYNVTEDCDLGLRLKRYRMNTVILDSTTLEEANPQLKNWIRQRSRWIKGYMQTYLVHMRHPVEDFRKGRLYDLFSFQYVIGSGMAVLFLNPLMWILLGLYLVFGQSVVNVYHVLFPGPILYLGAICLLFGNFFYIYINLVSCMKRKQYHLLPWILFIPGYWLLMSIAALLALFELMVKPHYWQKTVHGLHLKGKQASAANPSQLVASRVDAESDVPVPVIPRKVDIAGNVPSVSMSLKAVRTLIMPAISPKQKQAETVAKRSKVRDLWFVATVVIACIASVVSCWYYFHQHEIVLYQDSLSHMRISRSVFDNLTPGLAQLGSVWLPLPHVLMWPFIWNDYLWHSGLAGSFVSMPCYVIAAICVFLAARRLTQSSSASFIGTLVIILNPNVLYLQSIPLSETVCLATSALTAYFFLCWVQDGKLQQLILVAVCAFFATLARYDGWALFVGVMFCVVVVGLMRRMSWQQIRAHLLVFGVLGGLGIALWLLWNKIIFGDPLYFQKGLYSSEAQQSQQLAVGQLFSYHNIWQSFRFYTIDSVQTIGVILFALAFVGIAWFVLKHKFTPVTLAALLFAIPFPFYILALYGGQAVIWIPGANPPDAHIYMYNVRYGAQMVVPASLFVALLVERIGSIIKGRFLAIGRFVLLGVIIAQTVLITSQGIITVQDSQFNYACGPQKTIVKYLEQHYNGGRILQDVYASQFDVSDAGIDFRNVIYEGSGQYWQQALEDPTSQVDWIVIRPDNPLDLVSQQLKKDPAFNATFHAQYTQVASQTNGIYLYHINGKPPLPARPAPITWNAGNYSCSIS